MVKRRIIPNFHLEVRTVPSSGRLLVRLVEAPDLKRMVPAPDVESPLKQTYKSEEALGHALYECLFHDDQIRHKFEVCRKKYCTGKIENRVGLRLILDIQNAPKQEELLLSLPWELLHDERDWLALDSTLSITRRLNVKRRDVQEHGKIHPPLHVLLTYAEPKDKRPFGGERAFEAISKVIRTAIKPSLLKGLPHTTKRKFKLPIQQGFHVVHFLGHGDIEAEKAQLGLLFLELEESPSSDILTATELAGWMVEAAVPPKLFVLTACHSGNPTGYGFLGVATALLDVGVEAVIAMQTELYIDEATAFAKAFYRVLGDRLTVDDAMQAGRQALHSHWRNRSPEAGMLRLLAIPDDQQGTPIVQGHLGTLKAFERRERTKSLIALPGWAVPTLFLQGDGWLGQGPPEPLITWPKDQKGMVYIPEGNFYIDRYPVTCREYQRFADIEGLAWDAPPWKDEEDGTLPATNMTWQDAQTFAGWSGKHLSSVEEWQQAALSGLSDKVSPFGR